MHINIDRSFNETIDFYRFYLFLLVCIISLTFFFILITFIFVYLMSKALDHLPLYKSRY